MKKIIGFFAALYFCACNVFAADCSRATSDPSDGEVLYAADYIAELNNAITCANGRVQDSGDTMTGDLIMDGGLIKVYDGNDLRIYSDGGTTLKASITGSSGASVIGLTQAGQLTNCGISNTGTTFTIAGYNGVSVSATSPCVVAVRSATAGRVELAYFTSNVTFTHGSSSDTDGNLFGLSEADWSSAMPFFLGVVTNGTTPYFIISRVPLHQTGSAATDLCQKGDTDCDSEKDAMVLATGLTLASWVDLPVTQIGWFQMTYATSGNAWTASVTTKTGFNFEYEKILWTFPTGQKGAVTSYHINNTTGSGNPTWATAASITYYYKLSSAGQVFVSYYTNAAGNVTNGSYAGDLWIMLPFASGETGYKSAGKTRVGAGNGSTNALFTSLISYIQIESTAAGGVSANSFSNSTDDLSLSFNYSIF